jgi:drug/metabolite transporter (DMT)-like permease
VAASAISERVAGLSLAAMSAALWASGGIAAQELFSRHHVDPGWLAGVRMACGGLLLLVAFRPAWPRRQAGLLIAVAVVGIAGAQYTWFAAIDKSNLALATFVQYSAVPMTAGWQMLRRQVRPTVRRLTAVAAAGTGVWLLAAGVPGGLRASRAIRPVSHSRLPPRWRSRSSCLVRRAWPATPVPGRRPPGA